MCFDPFHVEGKYSRSPDKCILRTKDSRARYGEDISRVFAEKKPAGMNYGASTILTLGLKLMPDKKHQNGRFRGNLM